MRPGRRREGAARGWAPILARNMPKAHSPLARFFLGLLLGAVLAAGVAHGQPAPAARESAIKAAFLYKFGSFVEWPAGTFARPEEPLVIGVAGDEAVAADLEQVIAGRTVEGRPVIARRIRDAQAATGVNILFIGGTRESRLRELLPPPPAPVLVVTEQDGALRLGSSINFSAEGGRVRFAASPSSAEARGIRLSSRLLAVAQAVEGRSR